MNKLKKKPGWEKAEHHKLFTTNNSYEFYHFLYKFLSSSQR